MGKIMYFRLGNTVFPLMTFSITLWCFQKLCFTNDVERFWKLPGVHSEISHHHGALLTGLYWCDKRKGNSLFPVE